MGIRVERFPGYDVEVHLYSGPMVGEEVIRHFRELGPADALRWIHYLDPTADMSVIDVACLPLLKHTIASKKEELFGDRPSVSAIVYGSRTDQSFFSFWRSYAAAGELQPRLPVLFSSLGAACEWMRLPEAGRKAVMTAAGLPLDEAVEVG
jgi:hypothetical protein